MKLSSVLKKAKSLSEFKRQLQLGSKWHCFHHGFGDDQERQKTKKDMGEREVSKVQSNAVAFKTDRGTDSWLWFPKASEIKFENGAYTILEDGLPLLTYKKVSDKKAAQAQGDDLAKRIKEVEKQFNAIKKKRKEIMMRYYKVSDDANWKFKAGKITEEEFEKLHTLCLLILKEDESLKHELYEVIVPKLSELRKQQGY